MNTQKSTLTFLFKESAITQKGAIKATPARIASLIILSLLFSCGGQSENKKGDSGQGNSPPNIAMNSQKAREGADLWNEQCSSCHGTKGEGVVPDGEIDMSKYQDRGSLITVIDISMPQMRADECNKECAEKIAEYMFSGFSYGSGAKQVIPISGSMQRLNRTQYNRTVQNLMGTQLSPGDSLPIDSRSYGYDTAGSVLLIDDLYLEAMEKSAITLTEEFFNKPNSDIHRQRYLSCDFSNGDSACIKNIVEKFSHDAWRRPLNNNETQSYTDFFETVYIAEKDAEFALSLVFQSILMSPNFIYRVESDEGQTATHRIDHYEMASRLSYLIWSSMPDEELFELAAAKKLHDPKVLSAQVNRLFADPKADAFSEQFGAQYLVLHGLDAANPSPNIYPLWRDDLADLMRTETLMYFKEFAHSNELFANKLISAPFTFLNSELADYYDISGVNGDGFSRVSLVGSDRTGVLGQGAFLTSTSISNRTSPVARGMWVLEQLLCNKTPEPPANVDTDLVIEPGAEPKTTRERLEQHRADPNCRGCHLAIDSIGIGFENFDGIGRYRNIENGLAVDSSAVLPDGSAFSNIIELADLLSEDERFLGCFVQHLSTYSNGVPSGIESARTVAARSEKPTIQNIVKEFVLSDLFQMRVPGLSSANSNVGMHGE